jgi:putative ABC transport system permease protein
MDEVLSASLAAPNVYTLLLGVFAVLALVLAAVGLYGVVSFGVTQRVHEIGIRMALGAERGEILRMVLRQGLILVVGGTGLGLVCALGVGRLLLHLVPSVQPGDPMTLAGLSVLLMGVPWRLVSSRHGAPRRWTPGLRCATNEIDRVSFRN